MAKEKEPVEEDLAQSMNKKIVHMGEGSIELFLNFQSRRRMPGKVARQC